MDHIHLTYLPWGGIFLQGGNQLEEISFSNKMARPLSVFLCSGHPSSRRLAFIEWNQTCSSSLLQSKAKEQSSAQRICNYLRNSQEFWAATASSALGSRLTKQLEKHKTSSPPYTPSTLASQQRQSLGNWSPFPRQKNETSPDTLSTATSTFQNQNHDLEKNIQQSKQ